MSNPACWSWRALFILALLLGAGCSRPDESQGKVEIGSTAIADPPPGAAAGFTVIVVVVDALRADHLGCYGYPNPTTPEIDHLAETALLLEHASSAASGTVESTASLFTSVLPPVHRITYDPEQQEHLRSLSDHYLLLTEAFSSGGYHTGIYTTRGWVSSAANYMQGVDERVESARHDRHLVAEAGEFIARNHDRPFFLYVHMIDMHDYFHPKNLFQGIDPDTSGLSTALLDLRELTPRQVFVQLTGELREPGRLTSADVAHLQAVYDRLLTATDSRVAELVGVIDRYGLRDRTLLVLTADHGERFGEHGWLVHSGSVYYREVTHIPLVISCPGLLDRQRRVSVPASTIDLGPTLLDLVGLEIPAQHQGESLLRQLDADRTVFTTNGTIWRAAGRDWSYYTALDGTREDELYNLASDPGETRNLATERPQERKRFRHQVEAAVASCRQHEYLQLGVSDAGIPEDQREALRSLGYLD